MYIQTKDCLILSEIIQVLMSIAEGDISMEIDDEIPDIVLTYKNKNHYIYVYFYIGDDEPVFTVANDITILEGFIGKPKDFINWFNNNFNN